MFSKVCGQMKFYQIWQGLKRLKKLQPQPQGRCGQLSLSECSTTEEQNRSFSVNAHQGGKRSSESVQRDRLGAMPMSIKLKRMGNEEAMSRQRGEQQRRDRFHDLGRTMREPPSIEIGPKRLKVRGPSFIGWESRLE